MDVIYLPEADDELQALKAHAPKEALAIDTVVNKLQLMGSTLRFPHCSHVQGAGNLWELRPRSGRSPWRAFYRRIGEVLVIGAIGPEANVDRPGFRRATARAEDRLDAYPTKED